VSLSGGKAWAVLIALILSLCLNSFFVGAILTRQGARDSGGLGEDQPGRGLVALAGFQRLVQGLPAETRVYLRDAFEAEDGEITPALRALRVARRAVLDTLSGEAFAPDSLAGSLALVRERTVVLQELLHGIFVDAVAAMPPAMRHEMAEIWRSR
jgi:hypothetical protein